MYCKKNNRNKQHKVMPYTQETHELKEENNWEMRIMANDYTCQQNVHAKDHAVS